VETEDIENNEIEIAVEKGSPEDQMLQVLKHKGIEAEITRITIRGGSPGGHQLAEVEGILTCLGVATSFTAWAIILPSGRLYLLSIQDAWNHTVPVIPYLYSVLLGREGSRPIGDPRDDLQE
jgi:hypothetical protein